MKSALNPLNPYRQLAEILANGQKAVLISYLSNMPDYPIRKIVLPCPFDQSQLIAMGLSEELCTKAAQSLCSSSPILFSPVDGEEVLVEPHRPEPRLFIFGGGHIAQPLVELAAITGFSTTVIDDRPIFANAVRFPLASQVFCESFEHCFSLLDINESDYIVIITRGHRHDLDCLRQVLKMNTTYVGMIGSRRRIKHAWQQLLAEGYSGNQLSHVHAPIGIPIGAITPAEIALSIIAQIIGVNRLGPSNTKRVERNLQEENRQVLETLACPSNGRRAIVTIVNAKGSVPRKPGAKMIVEIDGTITGSIGGGCSESEIILAALEVISTGRYRLHRIDLTGNAAEDEGMICGGIMDVLIESFG